MTTVDVLVRWYDINGGDSITIGDITVRSACLVLH